VNVEALMAALPDDAITVEAPTVFDDDAAPEGADADEVAVTFRLQREHWLAGTMRGLALGVTLFVVGAVTRMPVFVWAGFPLSLVAGALWLRGPPTDRCARGPCRHRLAPDVTECPGCGSLVVGRVKNEMDRLAAEDAYRDAQAQLTSSRFVTRTGASA
jgi:hypothetical protein